MNTFTAICTGLLTGGVCLAAYAERVVTDSSGERLPKASVFGNNGNVVGVCDENGVMPELAPSLYPLTVRYVGFEPATVLLTSDSVVVMSPASYDLPELVIDNESRSVLHLVGYMREYNTMTSTADTNLTYSEKVVDFMIPRKKVKKFKGWSSPRTLARRDYVLFTNKAGLDSVSSEVDDTFSWSNFVNLVTGELTVPDSLINGTVRSVTKDGKYSPKMSWRKTGDDYTLEIDALADHKDHIYSPNVLKFFGLSTDFSKLETDYMFTELSGNKISAENVMRATFGIEALCRGKLMKLATGSKEPFNLNSYYEFYVTQREYLTPEEARELKDNPPRYDRKTIAAPEGVASPDPAIMRLIERVEKR